MMLVKHVRTAALKVALFGATSVLLATGCAAPAMAAQAGTKPAAETPTVQGGGLDPATFEGTLVVATPSGAEVAVDVRAGEAPFVADTIQAADAAGALASLPFRTSRAVGCGQKVRSVAGIANTYATSVQGCAVIGYPGYRREYVWENTSDVSLCTKARGFNASNAPTWYTTGCGNGATFLVPWGNTLAYTQMQASSMSWATGAAYLWRA